MSAKEKGIMEMVEEDKNNLRNHRVVVMNFCYTCPFVKTIDEKAKSGNPICECDHPALAFRDPCDHPVLDPNHAFIPKEKCPLQEGAWTIEPHPRDRRIEDDTDKKVALDEQPGT